MAEPPCLLVHTLHYATLRNELHCIRSNHIKLHYLKKTLHTDMCKHICKYAYIYSNIYIYASSANTSNKIVIRILEEPYVPRLHQL